MKKGTFFGIDTSSIPVLQNKIELLKTGLIQILEHKLQRNNPDTRILLNVI